MDKGSVPPLSSGENGMTVLEDTIAPSIHIPTFSPFVKCKSERKVMIYMIFPKDCISAQKERFLFVNHHYCSRCYQLLHYRETVSRSAP